MRSLTPSAIRHNVRAALSIRRALKKADRIIRDFQPDVILGTGGYASYPDAPRRARSLGIPTAVHESNAVPGLATKMVADKVDRILVSFADSRSAYRDPYRVVARRDARAGGVRLHPPRATPAALSASTRRRR